MSENGTAAEIKPAIDKLQAASYEMAELLYQKVAPEGAPSGNGASHGQAEGEAEAPKPSEDVIDAEFKESK